METVLSRYAQVLVGDMPSDRLPLLEWAWWWDDTVRRWQGEGLPAGMDEAQIKTWFGLDVDHHLTFGQFGPATPPWPAHGQPLVRTEAEYEHLLPLLYPDPPPFEPAEWRRYQAEQDAGTGMVWFNLLGFFWWPRTLLGIEGHLLAFYDQPALIHRINRDQLAYQRRCIEALTAVARPVMMNFWEDLSYNHGPMLSRAMFDEFLAPYYHQIIPELVERGIVPLLDSDGQIEPLIPWFEGVGIRGCGPLERMAGVDVNRIRREHPRWIMMGGFDKTVMPLGEQAMRAEFERILPAMRAGRYIPSVDHQTPPGVSLAQYQTYRHLQDEYAARAVTGSP
jgi:hypothetical protein